MPKPVKVKVVGSDGKVDKGKSASLNRENTLLSLTEETDKMLGEDKDLLKRRKTLGKHGKGKKRRLLNKTRVKQMEKKSKK